MKYRFDTSKLLVKVAICSAFPDTKVKEMLSDHLGILIVFGKRSLVLPHKNLGCGRKHKINKLFQTTVKRGHFYSQKNYFSLIFFCQKSNKRKHDTMKIPQWNQFVNSISLTSKLGTAKYSVVWCNVLKKKNKQKRKEFKCFCLSDLKVDKLTWISLNIIPRLKKR